MEVHALTAWTITSRGWEIALVAVSCLNDCAKIPMDWPRLRRKLLEDWARAWRLRLWAGSLDVEYCRAVRDRISTRCAGVLVEVHALTAWTITSRGWEIARVAVSCLAASARTPRAC